MGFYSQILAFEGQQELGNPALEAFLEHKEETPCESGAAAFLPFLCKQGCGKGFMSSLLFYFFSTNSVACSWGLMPLSMNENVINLLVQRHHLWPPIERILLRGFFPA